MGTLPQPLLLIVVGVADHFSGENYLTTLTFATCDKLAS